MKRAVKEDKLLSTGQVARLLGVSTETIRQWIKKGIIGYTLVGNTHVKKRRVVRIRQSEADRHHQEIPAEIV